MHSSTYLYSYVLVYVRYSHAYARGAAEREACTIQKKWPFVKSWSVEKKTNFKKEKKEQKKKKKKKTEKYLKKSTKLAPRIAFSRRCRLLVYTG